MPAYTARAAPEGNNEKQPKEKHFSFIKMIAEALVLTLIVLIVYLLSPYELVSTSTDSMAPELPVGSISIAVKSDEKTTYEIGDIITFSADYGGVHYSRITHRIVNIDGDTFITKGDHNAENDPFTIERNQIRNKVRWTNVLKKE